MDFRTLKLMKKILVKISVEQTTPEVGEKLKLIEPSAVHLSTRKKNTEGNKQSKWLGK